MIARRTLLAGLRPFVVAGGAWTAGAYRASMAGTDARLSRRSSIIDTGVGALEYAVAGHGPPLMMIHGTGGGFDQGLLFANRLRESGFQIVAPSRFGYLKSAFPDDASPAHQADMLVELLVANAQPGPAGPLQLFLILNRSTYSFPRDRVETAVQKSATVAAG